jgi:hypothetical protein
MALMLSRASLYGDTSSAWENARRQTLGPLISLSINEGYPYTGAGRVRAVV